MLNFPPRLLSCSALTLGDPQRYPYNNYAWDFMREIKYSVNSDRIFLNYPWPHKVDDIACQPFNLLWQKHSLKLHKFKLDHIWDLCKIHNADKLIPIITVFDACGITHRQGFTNNPLNKANGGILKQGGKEGLLDFYRNHLKFAADTINAVINRIGDCTVIIEPMNESRGEDSIEWLVKIAEALNLPPNIRLMHSDNDVQSGLYLDEIYDYQSIHGICKFGEGEEWGWAQKGIVYSTDGCRNTGGDYFQRRPGAKQIEPILKWARENGVGVEFMTKYWDFNGRLSEEDYAILHLLRKYGIQKPEEMEEHKPEIK